MTSPNRKRTKPSQPALKSAVVRLIREYVRELAGRTLQESSPTGGRAVVEGLALSAFPDPWGTAYVLWKPTAVIRKSRELTRDGLTGGELATELVSAGKSNPTPYLAGYMTVLRARPGVTLGAAQVVMAAATGGWGPMLYDFAMADQGRLTAHRSSVSPSAERVWGFYLASRGDVRALPLDDELHDPPGPGNPLNYAYELVDPGAAMSSAATVLSVGEEAIDELVGLGMRREDVERFLTETGSSLYRRLR